MFAQMHSFLAERFFFLVGQKRKNWTQTNAPTGCRSSVLLDKASRCLLNICIVPAMGKLVTVPERYFCTWNFSELTVAWMVPPA